MIFARIVLAAIALVTLAFGVYSFLAPGALAELVGLTPQRAGGLTELRAFYGGVELGLGGFWLGAASSRSLLRPGLLCAFAVWALVAVSRTVGMVMDDSISQLMLIALGSEATSAVLAGIAYLRLGSVEDS